MMSTLSSVVLVICVACLHPISTRAFPFQRGGALQIYGGAPVIVTIQLSVCGEIEVHAFPIHLIRREKGNEDVLQLDRCRMMMCEVTGKLRGIGWRR